MEVEIVDRPWRLPGAAAYGRARFRALLRPPVTVVASDVLVEREVAVTMRDGTVLRANVYQPAGDGPWPVLLSAHPYGKDNHPALKRGRWTVNPQFRVMNQPVGFTISSETGWEAPDPTWWTEQGYVVINADLRGAGTSEGVGTLFSRQEGEDTYDLIEWAGTQSWSTGRVGMLGVSYLAITQYRAAALRPPHLAAICPWEGFTDAYRDFFTPGGVTEKRFSRIWLALSKRVARLTGDLGAARRTHPLRDSFWESLDPALGDIEVPMLVCTSFSDSNLHSVGSFRAFTAAGSVERFAYTHRGPKWAEFYGETARAAQLRFFDRFLRDVPAEIPRVRLEVRSALGAVVEVRDEQEWPLARTAWTALHLQAGGELGAAAGDGTVSFGLRRAAASFSHAFEQGTELTGPMSVRLRVSLDRPDANLFVGVEKWSGGRFVPFEGSYGYGRDRVATGRQRVALRRLDDAASLPGGPAHDFRDVEPVRPGEIVSVDVALSPSSTLFRAADVLRLVISGRALEPRNPLTGHFPAWYEWSKRGRCTIHLDGSALTIPVIPSPGTAQ